MTKQEMFEGYRDTLLGLAELEMQLNRVGTDGRPNGTRGAVLNRNGSGTNDPASAMRQLAEGLEEMAKAKRQELAELEQKLSPVMRSIRDLRTYAVMQGYYLQGANDESIGEMLALSRQRVCQLRLKFLREA